MLGGLQSALLAQVVLQAVAPQAKAPHGVEAAPRQVPLPSQWRAAVCAPMLQDAGTQIALLSYLRQPPAPSHVPSVPQLETDTESQ